MCGVVQLLFHPFSWQGQYFVRAGGVKVELVVRVFGGRRRDS